MKTIIVPYPGEWFAFKWPWFFLKREYGMAQMLAIENEGGIVHVRVFANDKFNPISVGHIPILASCVVPSLHKILERRSVPTDCWGALVEWRELHKSGIAGAFSVPLWKAVRMSWEVVNNQDGSKAPNNFFIESAFPIANSEGKFTSVRAIGCHLVKSNDGAS